MKSTIFLNLTQIETNNKMLLDTNRYVNFVYRPNGLAKIFDYIAKNASGKR